MKTSANFFLLGLLLVGCAKEKSFETIYKESTFTKDMLSSDPNDPYVYIPSVANTPMDVTASRPYWSGEQKLVTFKFTENHLEVLELPTDKRFAQNENNFSPVFKLDVDHKDYRCAEDQYGECANKEEEVDDSSWQAKRFFKADFSKLTVLETNSLPEQLSNLFNRCFSDKGSVVKKVNIEKDALNVIVERTLQAGVECADISWNSWDDVMSSLRNVTFKVNYHYSFVKLSKLASKNYEPVAYPNTDQNTFGFFTTKTKKLTADNQTTLDSDLTLMNRWNPKRGEIVYHLNDSFYDKDMKSIKKATEQAVGTINQSFAQAGVDLKITLADGRNKDVGDLRNNFLVLVKDPQASGVIGYGPSVANPLTGEILKAQTVMYYGTIRKYIQETYDELVAEANDKAKIASSNAAKVAAEVVEQGAFKHGVEEKLAETQAARSNMRNDLLNLMQVKDTIATSQASTVILNQPHLSAGKLEQRLKGEIFSHSRVHKHTSKEDMLEEYSRNNMYHESMVNWNDAVASAIEAGELNLKGAKPWNDLKDSEKDTIIEKLMPFVWIPTLVHELGHNLGLRHNFNGSEDKENYFSEVEQQNMKLKRKVTYSSVMDYSYSSLNQLPIMGKYDLAALRFGYNRQVEKKDGTIITMPKATLEEMRQAKLIDTLKDYKFCTDEHVAVNAGCNRFDEGTSLTEIAEHLVKDYKKKYDKRNKRNNRLVYSSSNDGNYYMGVRYTFQALRVFFEMFDRIKGMYPSLAAEQWESIEFLKDLKGATKVVADFYVEVLKIPSVHCAVVSKQSGQLAGIIPLEDITFEAISCFDDENIMINKELYEVVAQTGKHFNHARSPSLRGDIKADPTQISIRGIWADKVLAMDYLMKREMGISSFDDYRTSFLDHPEFKDQVLEAVLGMMNDKISHKAVEFVTADGQRIPLEHDFAVGDTHNITRSFSTGLNRFLGIKRASTDYREVAIPMIKTNLLTADEETTTAGLLQSLSVYKVDPTTVVNNDAVAAKVKLKDASGRGVTQFVATEGNVIAVKMIKDREVRQLLEKHPRDLLVQIYQIRAAGKTPEQIPEQFKDIFEMKLETLQSYLLGEMPSDKDLNRILSIMSLEAPKKVTSDD